MLKAQRLKELAQIEDQLAEAKAQLVELTYWRKIVLAEQMLKAKDQGAKSVAEAEMIARNSKEYREAVKALAEATKREASLWFMYRRLCYELGV